MTVYGEIRTVFKLVGVGKSWRPEDGPCVFSGVCPKKNGLQGLGWLLKLRTLDIYLSMMDNIRGPSDEAI